MSRILPWLLVVSAAWCQQGTYVRGAFPDQGETDGAPTLCVVRVIDGRTGRPIRDARLHAVLEHDFPLPAVFEPALTGLSDADGWARVDIAGLGDRRPWWYVEAEGYAPQCRYSWPDEAILEMMPGADVPIRVLDAMDRPAAGVGVGLILGCGHTPDVRHVTTDASGMAVMENVGPRRGELWPVRAGLVSEYGDMVFPPDADMVTVRCDPAAPIVGRVLDLDGRPVAGAAVGNPSCHRGPWTRTDEDGRFVLLGAPDRSIYIHHPLGARDPGYVGEAPPPGFAYTPRLGPAGDPWEPAPLHEVAVIVRDERGVVLGGIEVNGIRLSDGYTDRGETDGGGTVKLSLPAGEAAIVVGGGLGGVHAVRIDVEVAEATRVTATTRRYPTSRIDASSAPSGRIHVVTPTEVRDVTTLVLLEKRPVPLPPRGEVAIRCTADGRVHHTPVPESRRGDGSTIVLEWPEVKKATPTPVSTIHVTPLTDVESIRVHRFRRGWWDDTSADASGPSIEATLDLAPGDFVKAWAPGHAFWRHTLGPRPDSGWKARWDDTTLRVHVAGESLYRLHVRGVDRSFDTDRSPETIRGLPFGKHVLWVWDQKGQGARRIDIELTREAPRVSVRLAARDLTAN